jgi:hypothetical protein
MYQDRSDHPYAPRVQIDQLETTLATFEAEQQELLNTRLQTFVNELGKLPTQAEGLAERVPLDLVKLIDEGGNGDAWFVDVIRKSVADNQLAKGKVHALQELRTKTLALAAQDDSFKDAAAAYANHVGEPLPGPSSSK